LEQDDFLIMEEVPRHTSKQMERGGLQVQAGPCFDASYCQCKMPSLVPCLTIQFINYIIREVIILLLLFSHLLSSLGHVPNLKALFKSKGNVVD
jgi:hypothetical protein